MAYAHLLELKSLAVDRGFEFSNLVEGSTRLQLAGISAQRTTEIIKSATNATAALGGKQETLNRIVNSFEMMADKSEVAGRQILQLERMGVPALKILADATGLSVKQIEKLATAGRLKAQPAIRILTEGFDQRFGGLAEKVAQRDLWRAARAFQANPRAARRTGNKRPHGGIGERLRARYG